MKTRLRALAAGMLLLGSLVATTDVAAAQEPYGTKILNAGDWLSGGGVDVYSNGSSSYVSNDYSTPAVGMKWQCVELAQRLYTAKGWRNGMFPNVGVAADIWGQAGNLGMSTQANGSISSIVPGDMIIHGYGFFGGAGHVAVVDSVSGSTVNIVEQNFSSTGRATYTLSNGSLSRSGTTDIKGVVHDSDNVYSPPPSPASYIASLRTNNELYVRNTISGGWQLLDGNVKAAAVAGNRIASVRTNNELYVRDGINGGWTLQDGNVASAYLGGNYIGSLRTNGQLWVKDGINGAWILLDGNVKAAAISGNRIASLRTNNELYVRDGINGGWNLVDGNVAAAYLGGDYIGSLRTNGDFLVKQGIQGGWVLQYGNVKSAAIWGQRIGAVLTSDLFYTKEGINGGWTLQDGYVASAYLGGDYIGSLRTNGQLWAKVGVNGGWQLLDGNVKAAAMG